MKEIIENIQMLFDNKEFTLVDELLKGQGLDYNVLNCSRLLDGFNNNHHYFTMYVNDDYDYITFYRNDNSDKYMIFQYLDEDNATKEQLVDLLVLLDMEKLTWNLRDTRNSKWNDHIGEVTNDELVEFILKLNDYIITCGTK